MVQKPPYLQHCHCNLASTPTSVVVLASLTHPNESIALYFDFSIWGFTKWLLQEAKVVIQAFVRRIQRWFSVFLMRNLFKFLPRHPRINYLKLKLVSQAWKAAILSFELFNLRKELGRTEECLKDYHKRWGKAQSIKPIPFYKYILLLLYMFDVPRLKSLI